MKISAVIAEFNPLHEGHRALIRKMKENSDGIIAVMSGNFVQRGECSIFEKYTRGIDAVKAGVDLVLELPLVYSLASAEGFAEGAVKILHSCGIVSELWFGSEHGEIDDFEKAAEILNNEPPVFSSELTKMLAEGYSFPSARAKALELSDGPSFLLNAPNNILGTEYVRALKKLSSPIKAKTIKREGSGYNDTEIKKIPSASAVRKILEEGKDASEYITIRNETPLFMKNFDFYCAARLKTISKEELLKLPDCNEEIATRLKEASRHNSIDEILTEASCKSYTISRMRRILCNMMVQNTLNLPEPSYLRPLAMNNSGLKILKEIQKNGALPVASRGAALKNDEIFRLECRGTDIYNLARGKKGGAEFSATPQILTD